MASIFGQTFLSVSEGLLVIFFIAGISAVLTYKKVITQETIDGFSKLVVRIFLPFLIFYTVTTEFDPSTQLYWWKIPLAAIALPSVGLLISWILFANTAREKKSYFPLATMQNAAYLILPIGEVVYPDQFDEFSLICFLVVLGLSPFMWTVGKLLLTNDKRKGPGIKKLITPPFVANVLSIVLVSYRNKQAYSSCRYRNSFVCGEGNGSGGHFYSGCYIGYFSFFHSFFLGFIQSVNSQIYTSSHNYHNCS
jgi:predicted permease